jgi:hypothetical protein
MIQGRSGPLPGRNLKLRRMRNDKRFKWRLNMRELTISEIGFVSGAGDDCSSGDSGANSYGSINDTSSVGDEIIELYEGLVAATSHIIERVANAM